MAPARAWTAARADDEGVGKVKGTDEGGEAKKDQELVLYEFMNMLVRIAFQRANPTFGNFGDKKKVTTCRAASRR